MKEEDIGVACMVDKRIVYSLLVGKPDRKKPLDRYGCRWVHISKIILNK
jgi:hypothetical protein